MSGLVLEAVVEHNGFRLSVELDVAPGETLAIVGPNGAGKSTLVRAVTGLTPITGGRVELAGQVVDEPASDTFVPPHERSIGAAFQDALLFPHLSVAANVVLSIAMLEALEHVGLALATSIASWLNAGLLAYILSRRGQFTLDARLKSRMPRIIAATIAMAALLWLGLEGLRSWIEADPFSRGLALAVLIAFGMAAYAGCALAARAADLSEIRASLSRRRA